MKPLVKKKSLQATPRKEGEISKRLLEQFDALAQGADKRGKSKVDPATIRSSKAAAKEVQIRQQWERVSKFGGLKLGLSAPQPDKSNELERGREDQLDGKAIEDVGRRSQRSPGRKGQIPESTTLEQKVGEMLSGLKTGRRRLFVKILDHVQKCSGKMRTREERKTMEYLHTLVNVVCHKSDRRVVAYLVKLFEDLLQQANRRERLEQALNDNEDGQASEEDEGERLMMEKKSEHSIDKKRK